MATKSYSISDLSPYLSYNCPLDNTYLSYIARIILEYAPLITDFSLLYGMMHDKPSSLHCDISMNGDLYSIHVNNAEWAINILSEYKKSLLLKQTEERIPDDMKIDELLQNKLENPLRIKDMDQFNKLIVITNNKNKDNPNAIFLGSDCKILMYSIKDIYKSLDLFAYQKRAKSATIHGDAMPLLDFWKSNDINSSKLYVLHGPKPYFKILKPGISGMGWCADTPPVTQYKKDKITKCCRLYSIFYNQLSNVTIKHIFDFEPIEISPNCSYYNSKQKCLFFIFEHNHTDSPYTVNCNNNIEFKIVKYDKTSYKLWNGNKKNAKKRINKIKTNIFQCKILIKNNREKMKNIIFGDFNVQYMFNYKPISKSCFVLFCIAKQCKKNLNELFLLFGGNKNKYNIKEEDCKYMLIKISVNFLKYEIKNIKIGIVKNGEIVQKIITYDAIRSAVLLKLESKSKKYGPYNTFGYDNFKLVRLNDIVYKWINIK